MIETKKLNIITYQTGPLTLEKKDNIYASCLNRKASDLMQSFAKEPFVIGGQLLSILIPLFNLKPTEATIGISMLIGGVTFIKSLRDSSSQNASRIKKIALATLICLGGGLSLALSVKTPNEQVIEVVKKQLLQIPPGETFEFNLDDYHHISLKQSPLPFPGISKLTVDQFACACSELNAEKHLDVGGDLGDFYSVRTRMFPDDKVWSVNKRTIQDVPSICFIPPPSVCNEFKDQWSRDSIPNWKEGNPWTKGQSHTWGFGNQFPHYQPRLLGGFWKLLGLETKIIAKS
jgi:hypothetical protein